MAATTERMVECITADEKDNVVQVFGQYSNWGLD
jgi:hypothetical protein